MLYLKILLTAEWVIWALSCLLVIEVEYSESGEQRVKEFPACGHCGFPSENPGLAQNKAFSDSRTKRQTHTTLVLRIQTGYFKWELWSHPQVILDQACYRRIKADCPLSEGHMGMLLWQRVSSRAPVASNRGERTVVIMWKSLLCSKVIES